MRFETGNRYGKLLAVKELGRIDGERSALFKCDCGGEKVAIIGNVQRGSTRSCGCLKADFHLSRRLPNGEAQLRYAFDRTQRGAARRGYSFTLTKEQFLEISSKNCRYCGDPPRYQKQKSYASGLAIHGLDRMINRFGYTFGNCVACCPNCNMAKGSMTLTEFRKWIKKVHGRLNK